MPAACEMCQPYQGRVLSLTGKTEGYPTLEEARAEGLFHPRCRHAYSLHIDLDKEIREVDDDLLRKRGKSDIIEKKVDAFIDAHTPCLIERATGKVLETVWHQMRSQDLRSLKQQGWNFDWAVPVRKGYQVYGLTLKGDKALQGLIALTPDKEHYAIKVDLVESAPYNVGSRGQYEGVGSHLFAIAARMSFRHGFDGYVFFEAKTKLIPHYEKTLGARRIGNSQRMVIDTGAATSLMNKYFPGGD